MLKNGGIVAWSWISILILAAGGLIFNVARTPSQPLVHTTYASGTHIVFVVVAPAYVPSDKYVQAVRGARETFQEFAESRGYFFSTVGVAVQKNVEAGEWLLEHFGDFDEVSLGRGWFNSGMKRFTVDMGAAEALPQVAAIMETIDVRPREWRSLGRTELARFGEPQELYEWVNEGSPIEVPSLHADSGSANR